MVGSLELREQNTRPYPDLLKYQDFYPLFAEFLTLLRKNKFTPPLYDVLLRSTDRASTQQWQDFLAENYELIEKIDHALRNLEGAHRLEKMSVNYAILKNSETAKKIFIQNNLSWIRKSAYFHLFHLLDLLEIALKKENLSLASNY